ncbi:class F sortase [uncultured Serinicoccus sp.]|uniref:class F sortase n=1 Tax=uncultured Serinicoccus sp. TaxID=735514 RepID=UPI00261AE9B6|nr:class F sortase [uncultured Serinicoccus sp.]
MTDTAHRPRPARRAVTLALLSLVLVGALMAFWGWRGAPTAAGPDPVAAASAPPPAVTSAPDAGEVTGRARATPTTDAAARTSPSQTTATRAAATTTTPTPVQPEMTGDPQEGPVHVTIARGEEVLVDAPVALTQLNDRDELDPPPGVVGWYGPPQWSTVPGDLSTYPGVLAGHTSYDGVRDVFHRLGEVRAGDVVVIGYADGQEASFHVDADALSVPKNEVTEKAGTDYAWVWSLDEPGRTVSLFSCDLGQGVDVTGHSLNNWVVQATRTT